MATDPSLQTLFNKLKRSIAAYPWRWLAVAALVLVALVALRVAVGSGESAWDEIVARGELRVALDASYPPFENVAEGGQIVGLDVDLAREIGQRLGLDVTFVNIAYDGLYDALLTGQADVVISALVAADEFEGRADFSVPYFNAGEHLVVPTESAIGAMDDLDGRTVGVEIGSGGDVEASRWARRLGSLAVERYATPEEALGALRAGAVDAVVTDGVSARLAVGQSGDLRLAGSVADLLYAAAVPPESGEVRTHVNDVLEAMIDDGTVDTLIEQWFGPQR